MKNKAIGPAWEDVEKQLYTPEEIGASDLRAAIMCELIDARNEKGISQEKLEVLSGRKTTGDCQNGSRDNEPSTRYGIKGSRCIREKR